MNEDSPTTGRNRAISVAEAQKDTSALRRWGHVYKTRARTTTVVLVIVWFALLVFYGFSSGHYAEEPARDPARIVQQSPRWNEPQMQQETAPTTAPSTPVDPTTPTGSVEQAPESGPSTSFLVPPRRAPRETSVPEVPESSSSAPTP